MTLGYQSLRQGFKRVFTPRDVALLAKMDERHGTLSGLAMKKLMERVVKVYGEEKRSL